jgi:hypothetical protein
VSIRRAVPSEIEAEHISELVADVRAIPAAAFTRSKRATRRKVGDLSIVPRQRTRMSIPDEMVSLVDAADNELAGFRH